MICSNVIRAGSNIVTDEVTINANIHNGHAKGTEVETKTVKNDKEVNKTVTKTEFGRLLIL